MLLIDVCMLIGLIVFDLVFGNYQDKELQREQLFIITDTNYVRLA